MLRDATDNGAGIMNGRKFAADDSRQVRLKNKLVLEAERRTYRRRTVLSLSLSPSLSLCLATQQKDQFNGAINIHFARASAKREAIAYQKGTRIT